MTELYGINIKEIEDSKYKYELIDTYSLQTVFRPAYSILTPYIDLLSNGVMIIKRGYQYDGPSGISVDSDNFMRGSLVHDALYQLMDEGHLTIGDRRKADKLLYRLCRDDGMSWFRASYVYRFVRWFGGLYVKRKNSA